jgi:Flp pilus assembly protein TadD
MHNPAPLPTRFVQRLRPLLLCAALLVAHGAGAKDMETAQALWLQGQRDQALAAVQSALGQNPNNAQLRFAQAVMQMEMGQADKAEAGLQSLTQDFPDLADPYNNLAVLYAARGELDLARGALEQAVRMQPEHAQAQENLGDVMLRLAARAYQRALQYSHGDTSALQLKLSRTQALQTSAPRAGR